MKVHCYPKTITHKCTTLYTQIVELYATMHTHRTKTLQKVRCMCRNKSCVMTQLCNFFLTEVVINLAILSQCKV